MKKLFYILILIFIILIIIYIFKDKEIIKNKEYNHDKVKIIYPYFNNSNIDNYLNNYLKESITNYNKNNNIYIDYDYYEDSDDINLTFYKYIISENIVKEYKDIFLINLKKSNIIKNNIMDVSDYIYDGYYQKIIDLDKPMIALTFDDGPNYNTSKIIDILNKYNVKATFFILGNNIKGNETIIKKLDSCQMEIGNHTYSHKLLTNLTTKEIKEEFNKTNNLIYNIISKKPSLTRPSYGSVTSRIRNSINTPIIIWDIDTLDWKYHNSSKIYNKVITKVEDGDIVLMHDIYSATANSLELIIPKLLEQNYQLVTVSELFYYKGIKLKTGKVYGIAK